MDKLTDFDRDVLAHFVQHMPYENKLHFAALFLAESAAPVGRDALNASLGRLCAARLLQCAGEEIRASDEVKLAARGRFWNADGWKESLFSCAARREGSLPQGGAGSAADYIGAEQYERARRYAREAKKFAAGARAREGRTAPAGSAWAILFSLLLFAFAVLNAAIAVAGAVRGYREDVFIGAALSFVLFPTSMWLFCAGMDVRRARQGRDPFTRKRALFAAAMLSCLAHAAFFAALIPQSAWYAAGLAFVLVAAAVAAALYLSGGKPFSGRSGRIRKRQYAAHVYAFTRCAQFWLGGADVLSGGHRAPAQGASASLYAFGRKLDAEVWRVGEDKPFHIALASHAGVTVIGFPRYCDALAALSQEERRKKDDEKNAALEVALLRQYAARERAQAGSEALSWSKDGLISGFVCLQGEYYCAKCSAPFFNMPYDPAAPEAEGEVFEYTPAPDGPVAEEVSWEPVIEESFERREHAETFLRLVLAEADSEKLYAALAEQY